PSRSACAPTTPLPPPPGTFAPAPASTARMYPSAKSSPTPASSGNATCPAFRSGRRRGRDGARCTGGRDEGREHRERQEENGATRRIDELAYNRDRMNQCTA